MVTKRDGSKWGISFRKPVNITDIRYRRTVETSDNILKKQHSLKDRIKFPMYFKKDNVMTFYTFKHNSTCMAGLTTTMPLRHHCLRCCTGATAGVLFTSRVFYLLAQQIWGLGCKSSWSLSVWTTVITSFLNPGK